MFPLERSFSRYTRFQKRPLIQALNCCQLSPEKESFTDFQGKHRFLQALKWSIKDSERQKWQEGKSQQLSV